MSLRFHEIAEANHRILNPFTEEKLTQLGELCRLVPGRRLLDLACGKGELLAQWAARHGTHGIGVDISEVFLAAASARAEELGVTDQVRLVHGDAAEYVAEAAGFDVVSCLGATWIGDGLAGTVELMRPALRDGGIVLVGHPYWISEPPQEVLTALEVQQGDFASLTDTLDIIESTGFELIEMVLANEDSWDRYAASQWWTLSDWLRAHPDDEDAPAIREFLAKTRRAHLLARNYFGWGVFVLRPAG